MKIEIAFNSFDLFHVVHVKMIEDCKRNCDYLIVGLQTDPTLDRPNKNKPVQSIVERYIRLKHVGLLMKLYLILPNLN